MKPPNPILVHKAGIKNMLDFCIIWHLANVGLTGSTLPQLADAIGVCDATLRGGLARMETLKMVVASPNRDAPGHPLTWVCSRLSYRLMTGHLKSEERTSAGQLPLGSEIIHQS